MEVKRLEDDVKEIIRSGYCINSVAQCVNELVLNSIDANASHIAIRVNLNTFRIQVVDDGEGITESNMENVGKASHTNKCNSSSDLEKIRKQYGFKGESLYSIINNARVVKIASRARDSNDSQTHTKTMQKSICNNSHTIEEIVHRASCGTTVTVQEFMYNLPVRQKRTKHFEFDNIKANIQKLFIINPSITFSLRDDSNKNVIFNISAVDTVEAALRQQVNNLDENLIKYYSITKGHTNIKVLIYLKQHENNKWQLFYVNKLPIKSAWLASLVNEILSKSALGGSEYTNQNKKLRKSSNNIGGNYLYMFNISCPNSKYHIINFEEVQFRNPESTLKVIEKQLKKIMEKENLFLPELKQRKQIECDLQRRIRLSGFPGACKASANRNQDVQMDEDADEDGLANCMYNTNADKRDELDCNTLERKYENKPSLREPVVLSCSSSNSDYDNCQLEDENRMFTNESCIANEINTEKPLDTTSTFGKHYVLNKFLEDNMNFNSSHSYERLRRNHLQGNAMREARIEKKHQNELIAYRMKRIQNEVKHGERIPYLPKHDFNFRSEEHLLENRRNDAALANYYHYKHKMKYTKLNQLNLNHMKGDTYFFRQNDFSFLDKKNPKSVAHSRFDFNYDSKVQDSFTSFHHNFNDYKRKVPKHHKEKGHNMNVYNQIHDIKPIFYKKNRNILHFEEIDKTSFNCPLPIKKDTKQTFDFAKTVYNLDFSIEDPIPPNNSNKQRQSDDFFCLRASKKKRDRIKTVGQRYQKVIKCTTKTTTIFSTKTSMYPGIHTNSGRIPIQTFCCNCKASMRMHEYEKKLKRRYSTNKTNEQNKCHVMVQTINNINQTQENVKARDSELNGKVLMVEKSIQYSIPSEDNQNIFIPKEKIKIVENSLVQPLQDPNITSNDFCASNMISQNTKSVSNEQNNYEEMSIIEGTPRLLLLTPKGGNFHPCSLKMTQYKVNTQVKHICPRNNHANNNKEASKESSGKTSTNGKTSEKAEVGDINYIYKAKQNSSENNIDKLILMEVDYFKRFNLSQAIKELNNECSFEFLNSSNNNDINTNQTKVQSKNLIPNIANGNCQINSSEWSRQIDEYGGSYYINQRTGNNVSQLPVQTELFLLNKRPIDLPKGFSQILKENVTIMEAISNDTKREFHEAVCESYGDSDLVYIKWQKHNLQNAGYKEFFNGIYDKRFVFDDRELQLPKTIGSKQAPNPLNSVAFSKDMFHQLDVLRQYDNKFIVAVWQPKAIVVIFDQHAVDERVRVEKLLKKYVGYKEGIIGREMYLVSTSVEPFQVSYNSNTIASCKKYLYIFEKYGIQLANFDGGSMLVNFVPECLFNKAMRESCKRNEKLLELTKLLVYQIVDSITDAVYKHWIPPLITQLINSEACRGSIMFGDALSIVECGKLIEDLSLCDLPFQCAHGRPTCVPLFQLTSLEKKKRKVNLARISERICNTYA